MDGELGPTCVAYMDVDLSTDLNALLPLAAPLLADHSDVAIGNHLHRAARVTRCLKRDLISRAYNRLLRIALHTPVTRIPSADSRRSAPTSRASLIPLIEDNAWFFDTELLVLAQRRGLGIHEVPVDWVEDGDSRVDIVPTALADLRGIMRLLWGSALGTG